MCLDTWDVPSDAFELHLWDADPVRRYPPSPLLEGGGTAALSYSLRLHSEPGFEPGDRRLGSVLWAVPADTWDL